MTAASIGREGARFGVYPSEASLTLPVAASTILYQGTLIAVPLAGTNAGYCIPAAAAVGPVKIVGVAQYDVDNSAGAAGALNVELGQGLFDFVNSATTDAIDATMVGQPCYAADDSTVARAPGTAGTRPFAGRIVGMNGTKVIVQVGGPQADPFGNVDLALLAGADLSVTGQYLFMKMSAANTVVAQDTAGADCVGVLMNAPTSGAVAIVRVAGIAPVTAGGTIAAGLRIASTSAGTSKAAVAGTVSGSNVVGSYTLGIGLTAGAAAAQHRVLLSFSGVIPTTAA